MGEQKNRIQEESNLRRQMKISEYRRLRSRTHVSTVVDLSRNKLGNVGRTGQLNGGFKAPVDCCDVVKLSIFNEIRGCPN